MKGYWIARGDVTDEALYLEYGKRAVPAIEKFGGRFIVRGGRATTPEGRDYARNVVIEFDSYEQALACYDSPEYQESLKHFPIIRSHIRQRRSSFGTQQA